MTRGAERPLSRAVAVRRDALDGRETDIGGSGPELLFSTQPGHSVGR